MVGGITFLLGAPWWSLPLCAAAGFLISLLLRAWNSNANAPAPLVTALRVCRDLPLWDRLAMSALLVVTASAIYIGLKDLHILTAFYLFLLPIVLAQLLFGARCGVTAAFVSLIAIYYFAIPPKNSFAVHGAREVGLICAFALLAFITSATLAVLADVAGTKDGRQPQQ
jgi:K+-sensing histidine kinase KdpD